MPDIILHRWWMPARTPKGKPYLSRWAMSDEEAAKAGALRPEPSTREVRHVEDSISCGLAHVGSAPSTGHDPE